MSLLQGGKSIEAEVKTICCKQLKAPARVNLSAQALRRAVDVLACAYSMFGTAAHFVMHADEYGHILSQLDLGEWGKNTTPERTCTYSNSDVSFIRTC